MPSLDADDRIKAFGAASITAIGSYLESVTVVLFGFNKDAPEQTASGTLITIGGRYFVITCAHFVKKYDVENIVVPFGEDKLGYYKQNLPCINKWFVGGGADDQYDLGCLEIAPNLSEIGLSQKQFIHPRSLFSEAHLREDMHVITGFPTMLMPMDHKNQKMGIQQFVYGTVVEEVGSSHVNNGISFFLAYDERQDIHRENGGMSKTPLPHGLSGGGVWKLNMPEKDSIWSVEKIQLIGIEYEWYGSSKKAQAHYAKCWLDEFSKIIPFAL